MRRTLVSIALACLAVVGCGDDDGPPPVTGPTVAGLWTGTVSVPLRFTATFDLDLDERAGGDVSGTVTATGLTEEPVTGRLSGTHRFPVFTFAISTDGLGEVSYEGTYDGVATIDGTISAELPEPRSFPLTFNRP